MQNVRKDCRLWTRSTFEEMLLNAKDLSPQARRASLICFKHLEILKKSVNGYACEGLPKTEEGATGVGVNYTDVFHELYKLRRFTPVSYLAKLVDIYKSRGGSDSKIEGFVARGLRTLTSLIREPDFAESILKCLLLYEPHVKVKLNPKQDAKDHTDILVSYGTKTYRIWLYQFSSRGLPHDIERVSGQRGELPSGVHLLCPLKTEYAIEHERIERKLSRTKGKIENTIQETKNLSERALKARERYAARLDVLNSEFNELERQFSKVSEETTQELDIVEGWYFYSAAYVKRIGEMVHANVKPQAYGKVVSILTAAEKFLSEPRIFEKSN